MTILDKPERQAYTKSMALHHWFIPHKETHKKAHLISWQGIIIYILLFILLQVGFSIVSYSNPGVLGISSSVDQKKLIELTNLERQKKGLEPVVENEALDKAAKLKAANMFDEGYWAHFAPSGKSPWDFILGSGYKFTYAGENLAKNFYSSEDVVVAWMDSPTHRDNLLNPKYKDVGIAVVEGVLNGQKTTVVVQEFGSTQVLAAAAPSVNAGGQNINLSKTEYENKPELLSSEGQSLTQKSLIDPFAVSKYASLAIIFFMGTLLTIDLAVLYKRGVFRIGSHHVAHMSILTIAAGGILNSTPGVVL